MRRDIFLICASVLAISGCKPHVDPNDITSVAEQAADDAIAQDQSAAAAQMGPTDHNYTDKDGLVYEYVAAISNKEEDDGDTSGDVVSIRYLGQKDGLFSIAVDEEPDVRITCTDPCVIMKSMTSDGTVVSRDVFTPDSVSGAAFEDAFDGKLEVYK